MANATDEPPFRLFNDPVHGHIELNEACQLIVDTKEFQRLRDIKQLGFVDFVFPGATHTRFEHALGAYHLAGIFVRRLQKCRMDITEADILCVEIAALCHDIGCGMFSTLFSKIFIPLLGADYSKLKRRNKLMFNQMLKAKCANGETLKVALEKLGVTKVDRAFIKECIDTYEITGSTGWPYKGRNEDKAFLYEIVQNHRNGIDVCKFDYMARDCQNLGIPNNFDFQRYMEFARVILVEGEWQICARDKEVGNLYSMFFTRYNLHKFAYQHPVVCGIELMIIDVLKECKDRDEIIKLDDAFITIQGCLNFNAEKDQRNKALKGFTCLTDGVLFSLRNCTQTNLIERLYTRDIYRFLHQSEPMLKDDFKKILAKITSSGTQTDNGKIEIAIFDKATNPQIEGISVIQSDIRVVITYLDFGMKDENPIHRLRVYDKKHLNTAEKMDDKKTSRLLDGMNYNELRIRVYTTFTREQDQTVFEKKRDAIKKASMVIFEGGI